MASIADDESLLVKSEARKVLKEIHMKYGLRKQIKSLVPLLKATVDAICQLESDSELSTPVNITPYKTSLFNLQQNNCENLEAL